MTPAKNQPTPFRDDINGLRAWAVIAVLLFHFKVPGFSAGFIGVDIFFVISGFLMTGIIARGLAKNDFSIWQFYMARFRRIVPAVAVLIVVLLILGWYWLPTVNYQTLGKESLSSIAFISNLYYWRSAGYFGAAANEQWLLHTWSLGVEMQFYLLFPIFVLLVWKLKPSLKVFFYSLVALGLASLTISVLASSWQPVAAFYLLPTRGWELAAGGLVYFLSQNKSFTSQQTKLFYLTGLILWLVSFVVIDSSLAWPSGWALLPVAGTALIILAAQNNTLLMGNFIAQWLGNISYSVYLWHWPLVVALYFAGLQGDWLWITGFFTLSLVLGHLSYKLIETPTRKGLVKLSFSKQFASFALLALVIGISAVSVRLFTFEGRLPEAVEIAAFESQNRNWKAQDCRYRAYNNSIPACEFGSGELAIALFGDSHSQSIASALEDAAKNNNKSFVYLAGANGCPALKNFHTEEVGKQHCTSYIDLAVSKLNSLDKNISLLLATSNWSYRFNSDKAYQDALEQTVCPIAESGRKVYLMRQIPSMNENVPLLFVRKLMFGKLDGDIFVFKEEYLEKNKRMYKAQDYVAKKCGVKILDTTKYLCDSTKCYGSNNGRPMFFDSGHISEYGNKFLVPMFEEVFKAN